MRKGEGDVKKEQKMGGFCREMRKFVNVSY